MAKNANDTGNENSQKRVVLLHGLARTARSMNPLARWLTKDGYRVLNVNYPSTRYDIATLAQEHVFPQIYSMLEDSSEPIHFVTHSMGGIILRFLSRHCGVPVGRSVMLGPPNQGSEVVDRLGSLAAFRWLNGPAGLQMGTSSQSVPNQLGPVEFELGVIAGSRTINWILSRMITGPNDGKVSIERAKVEGMRDFLIVPYTHPLMMRRKLVIQQASYFLQHGRFETN